MASRIFRQHGRISASKVKQNSNRKYNISARISFIIYLDYCMLDKSKYHKYRSKEKCIYLYIDIIWCACTIFNENFEMRHEMIAARLILKQPGFHKLKIIPQYCIFTLKCFWNDRWYIYEYINESIIIRKQQNKALWRHLANENSSLFSKRWPEAHDGRKRSTGRRISKACPWNYLSAKATGAMANSSSKQPHHRRGLCWMNYSSIGSAYMMNNRQ